MSLFKKIFDKLKKPEKWIEIPIPKAYDKDELVGDYHRKEDSEERKKEEE